MIGNSKTLYLRDLLFLLLVFCAACSQKTDQSEKVSVVVSILPLAEFVERIGGDKIAVSVMVPSGASPHSYEPTPSQLVEVSKAQMYVKVGSPIEFELAWLDKILAMNREIAVTDASSGISLRGMSLRDKEFDPHVWLSPKNAVVMAKNIYNGLISVDPDNRRYYKQNKEIYINELDSLDHLIRQLLRDKKERKFMVYHPAWSYFAEDYELVQIPIEVEGKEPTAKDIQRIIEQARTYAIKVIFVSPQFNAKSAEVIAREIKGRVVMIDPLARDYSATIGKVAEVLSETME